MNRDEATYLLPIITAYAEGKLVECWDGLRWIPLDSQVVAFTNPPESYRIAPVQIMVNSYKVTKPLTKEPGGLNKPAMLWVVCLDLYEAVEERPRITITKSQYARGLVHLTRNDAWNYANALLRVNLAEVAKNPPTNPNEE